MQSRVHTLSFLSLFAALTACGGGGDAGDVGAPSPVPAPAPAMAPGGLYVGYYAESAANNPEDPMLGAYVLNLPPGDGVFSGNMFFTYVGCQSSNVGTVSGNKAGLALSGNWSGTVDGLAQAGTYTGQYDPASFSYSGSYANTGGKQYRDLRPCIEYFIAANGAWEMFPVEVQVPAAFSATVSGRSVNWTAVSNAELALVYVMDPAIAQTTGNPVVWQNVVTGSVRTTAIPANVTLVSGRQYVAAVGISGTGNNRLAFGSRRFTAP